ncbi:AAA family ATPase [Aureibacillus halotolerans]|uniref:Stage V sporulation protein K n=1 Tax=Aureibacillus halotolerans TaxID=1508390 RepID=A0A4R6U564_9BACI|nr:AAA family ATPase [Aureibacillus halotolerans]TDQ39729.1 stage V sporulation protein K [Aureibacillus halotolerans]
MEQSYTLKTNGQMNFVLNRHHAGEGTVQLEATSSAVDEGVHQPLKNIEQRLEQMVGMQEIKKHVKELYAWLFLNKFRERFALKTEPQVLHMLFKGNPGTGKTTVARLLGEFLRDMGMLPKGHLIEAERADLVGEYIGQTAQKTRDLVKKAQGGILFIDEAYSLSRGGEKDFGKEAVDTLVKHMEDASGEFVLILAGYPLEMERFLRLNPGLPSRFPLIIDFPDYTPNQLVQIARQMARQRDYSWTQEAEHMLQAHFDEQMNQSRQGFSNGRYVRNIMEKSVRKQAVRLLHHPSAYTKQDLMWLTAADIIFQSDGTTGEDKYK